ncbi:MAG: hypothetical protein HC913_08620 [Microscillaceae bacterium]|nr:hypothetical protein [Microscillaceae bacterium]
MSFFQQIIQKLFNRTRTQEGLEVREPLTRSENEKMAYQQWLTQNGPVLLLEPISKAYYYKKTRLISPIQVHLFQSSGANGFAITYSPTFGEKAFSYLLDFWKDRVLAEGYRPQVAERQMKEWPQYVETKEKYYLKPPIHQAAMHKLLCDQQFGNVLLEHVRIDQRSSYLKVLVTFYVDAQFSPARHFDDFANLLFAQP